MVFLCSVELYKITWRTEGASGEACFLIITYKTRRKRPVLFLSEKKDEVKTPSFFIYSKIGRRIGLSTDYEKENVKHYHLFTIASIGLMCENLMSLM